jgi:uncharacterized protein (DUF488 family)
MKEKIYNIVAVTPKSNARNQLIGPFMNRKDISMFMANPIKRHIFDDDKHPSHFFIFNTSNATIKQYLEIVNILYYKIGAYGLS